MPKKRKYVKQARFNWFLIPIMAVLGIVPLVVHLYVYDAGLQDQSYYYFDRAESDVFLAWKLYTFTALVFAMACVLIFKFYHEGKKIRFEKIFVPLGIYAALAFLSSLFSDHPHDAFTGGYEQFESVFALMGYAIAAYYAFLFVETEKDLKFILAALSFGVVCMLLIGLSQAFFTDFYQTKLGARLILPIDQWWNADSMEFKFEKGRVYMSLYNPNYVGSYVSFLFPIYVMLAINKWKFKTRLFLAPASIAVATALVLALVGSQSRAGFIGVLFSLLLFLVVMNKKLLRFITPITFVILLIITFIHKMNADSDNYYLNRLKSIFNNEKREDPKFSDMSADGDVLKLTYDGNTFRIKFDYDSSTGSYAFYFTDGDKSAVESHMEGEGEDQWIVPDDERFSMMKIRAVGLEAVGTAGFTVRIDGRDWHFFNTNTGVKLLSPAGKAATPYTSETFGPLKGHESFASSRGYIWSKTIPLLKDNIIIGSGADSFIYEFPNDDYLSLYNSHSENMLFTKPHNMYLQIGVQSGVISLIAILVFYVWYFVLGITTYTRIRRFDLFGAVGTGIFVGSFGYMIVQVINDSSITVAPIFWTMMGVGIALLIKTRKDLKVQLAEENKEKERMMLAGSEDAVGTEAVTTPAVEAATEITDTAKTVGDGAVAENADNNDTVSEEGQKNGSDKNRSKGSASRKGRRSHR